MIFYIEKRDGEELLSGEKECTAVCLWSVTPYFDSIAIEIKKVNDPANPPKTKKKWWRLK